MNINGLLFPHKTGDEHLMINELGISHDPLSVARDPHDALSNSNKTISTPGKGGDKHSITDELEAL
jgi:hypothetical protein